MTIMEPTELVTIPESDALAVFTTMAADGKSPLGILPYIDQVKAYAANFPVPSMDTEEGRDRLRAFAHRITKAKTAIEGVGKKLADVQKDIPKKIDASRRLAKTELEALHDLVRQPLTDWEAAESKRVEDHENTIRWMLGLVVSVAGRDSSDLRTDLEAVEAFVVDASTCQEFEERYRGARAQAIEALTGALERALKDEADRAELARLRAAEAKRQAEEAEAAAVKQREAEIAAQAERDKAIAAEAERLAAERLQKEAAEKAARDAAEAKRLADEKAKQAADVVHRAAINRTARDAFIAGGIPEDMAKLAVTLIAQQRIPNISITY